ncbi:MAG TPA: hypothetical protein VGK74_02500 [Symbiobacteriaceae bacterium]|jgi:hypothetical protein
MGEVFVVGFGCGAAFVLWLVLREERKAARTIRPRMTQEQWNTYVDSALADPYPAEENHR